MGSMGGAPPIPEPVVPEPEVVACEGPYCPRTGSFKMLAYSKTGGFRHTDSINTGKLMLQEIADEQGFEVSFTETNEEITADGLAQYEIVFFMNSTGDIFNNNEQDIYEDWMTTQNGAFGGVHSATDTENGWAFYSEVTGQYYDLHEACCVEANIQWEEDMLGFVAVQGLPNPWRRSEEWYYFNKSAEWSTKTGFTILSRVTSNNNTRPVSYVREWSNFRSFYTSLGHQGSAFEDDNVKRHVAAGIMWAVRREALLQ
jgi:type 1 glutamine amidotransferase